MEVEQLTLETYLATIKKIVDESKVTDNDRKVSSSSTVVASDVVQAYKYFDDLGVDRCELDKMQVTPDLFTKFSEATEGPLPCIDKGDQEFMDESGTPLLSKEQLQDLIADRPLKLDSSTTMDIVTTFRRALTNGDRHMLDLVVQVIRNSCNKHEIHRQMFVDRGCIGLLLESLSRHRMAKDVVSTALASLKSMTSDDDLSVPLCLASRRLRTIVTEGGIRVLIAIMRVWFDDVFVLSEAFSTLSSIAVRHKACRTIMDEGGWKLIIAELKKPLGLRSESYHLPAVVTASLRLLCAIGSDDFCMKNHIPEPTVVHPQDWNDVQVIHGVMSKGLKDADVCRAACSCLAVLAGGSPISSERLVEVGVAKTIVDILNEHQNDFITLKYAYRVVTVLVNESKNCVRTFTDLGIEKLIVEARQRHGTELQNFANALLKQLNCKMEEKATDNCKIEDMKSIGSVVPGRHRITQETFDAAVKEAIEELDMDLDDAVADAVQQFQALGADLQGIVIKKASDVESNGKVDVVAEAAILPVPPPMDPQTLLSKMERLLNDPVLNLEEAVALMKLMTAACDIDLNTRCRFGSLGATQMLFRACQHASVEVSTRAWQALIALTNGQPDVLTESNVKFVVDNCREMLDADPDLLVLAFRLVYHGCIKHEANRQLFVGAGLVRVLLAAVSKHRMNAEIVSKASVALRSLTLDDDVRVPFGRGHRHAQMIAADHGGIGVLVDAAFTWIKDAATLSAVLSALISVAVRNEFCQTVVDEDGLELVVDAMSAHRKTQSTVRVCLQLLKAIAGNDEVKKEIVKSDGVAIVVNAMSVHKSDVGVCRAGCACLAAFALRSPDNCRMIIDAGGANVIVGSIESHKDDAVTLKSAYRAVTNLVNRTKVYCQIFLDRGIERLLNEARLKHGAPLASSANSLMFLLGCKAEVKEHWTGEKGHLND